MAKAWANQANELQILRYQLRGFMQNGQKFKPENVSHGVEKALKMAWERFCLSLPVERFRVL